MKTIRRRRSDLEEPRAFLRSLPHTALYPALGFAVGLITPVGAFLMRYLLAGPLLTTQWIRYELQYNANFYAIMAIGTILSFMVFGYILGLRSEEQRVNNRILRARIDELHLKSVTDGLTGCYTHGYLHEVLELEMQRSLTGQAPLSLLLLDIDDFKKVNDLHGHLFGDRVIKETAETIAASVRAADIFGRLGGDEFLVIMPGADHEMAGVVARRICTSFAKSHHMATVSIGVASLSGNEKVSAADVLHRADLNLYQAKRDGKNRVCAGGKVVPAPPPPQPA
ncbi:MAG: GGDEF domain-containing protein [Elusimicrobia bacterium]|nr:GGDEF domain-containing protein [Elusimicrobiota bacterium]